MQMGSGLAFDFAAWAARSADMTLNEHGARMLGGMMKSGFASFVGIWDEVGDDKEYSHNPITLDNGDYDARVLKAWDDDIRILDFYRHGVFVRADIERFISKDVDAALASRASR